MYTVLCVLTVLAGLLKPSCIFFGDSRIGGLESVWQSVILFVGVEELARFTLHLKRVLSSADSELKLFSPPTSPATATAIAVVSTSTVVSPGPASPPPAVSHSLSSSKNKEPEVPAAKPLHHSCSSTPGGDVACSKTLNEKLTYFWHFIAVGCPIMLIIGIANFVAGLLEILSNESICDRFEKYGPDSYRCKLVVSSLAIDGVIVLSAIFFYWQSWQPIRILGKRYELEVKPFHSSDHEKRIAQHVSQIKSPATAAVTPSFNGVRAASCHVPSEAAAVRDQPVSLVEASATDSPALPLQMD